MLSIIYTTVPSLHIGRAISKHLLEQKLIACAHILPAGESLYIWQGKLEITGEHILIIKARSDFFQKIKEQIARLHPYECPCILEWDIKNSNTSFLQWAIGLSGEVT
ncbi:MAG: divalent-cation tolerance protein CutA [Alphaproteobacteria bacterium]